MLFKEVRETGEYQTLSMFHLVPSDANETMNNDIKDLMGQTFEQLGLYYL